jgi:TolA-binding protein
MEERMRKKTVITALAFLFASTGLLMAASQSQKIRELEKRIEKLEQAISKLQSEKGETQSSRDKATENTTVKSDKDNLIALQIKARKRMQEDWKYYSQAQLREIESLYQSKGYRYGSPEKTKNLKRVASEFSKSNRAGCAVLYLGQYSKDPKEQIDYLKKAISRHADCFYGDGVQVGAYARFWLAQIYLKRGDNSEASKLFAEIRRKYPDAVDHRGRSLTALINLSQNGVSKL